jgi:hypothetical protein
MWKYILPLMLTGCAAVPPAVQYASTGFSLGIWAGTGKTMTDHVISYVNDSDCEMIRALDGSDICVNDDEDEE